MPTDEVQASDDPQKEKIGMPIGIDFQRAEDRECDYVVILDLMKPDLRHTNQLL